MRNLTGIPLVLQSFWKIGYYATDYVRLRVRLPALVRRVGKQSNDDGVRSGLRGCLRRCRRKKFLRWHRHAVSISSQRSGNAAAVATAVGAIFLIALTRFRTG